MDNEKRRKISIGGSILVHIIILLLVAFTGILSMNNKTPDDIVEVVLAGGGGGGGSGADIENTVSEEQADETQIQEQQEPDSIVESDDSISSVPQKAIKKPVIKKAVGKGTGKGTGTGSGIGPGSGSGTGGGHGSGHGTGTGSGTGDGNSIYNSPAIPPRILRNPAPDYPAAERNAKIQGTTTLHLLVSKDGRVEQVDVITSSGNTNLDNAAIKACYKWRFTSARNQANQPVRCYLTLPITFILRN